VKKVIRVLRDRQVKLELPVNEELQESVEKPELQDLRANEVLGVELV